MIPKDLVHYQNKLYYIYKKMKPDSIKEGYVNDVKDFWRCDVVVRNKFNNDDSLLFLREISDLEPVRDVI
jgi:hypothetical protein